MRPPLVAMAAASLIVASCGGTSSASVPSSSSAGNAATSISAPPTPVSAEQVVYLLIEGQSGGPFVAPVLVAADDAPLEKVLSALSSFPPPAASLSSEFPTEARVLSLEVRDRVATIDLSSEFIAETGSFSQEARLAQLVYTATRSPSVDAVLISVEGQTPSFSDLEVDLGEPISRDTMRNYQGPVFIDQPPFGGKLADGVRGEAAVPGSLEARINDAEGALVATVSLSGAPGDGSAVTFEADVSYLVLEQQSGSLELFVVDDESVEASGITYQVQLDPPVSLETSCSAGALDVVVTADPQLPPAVDETRMAIIEAAASCDFAALGALASQHPFFTFSFGGGEDPARFWVQSESLGSPVTRRMVQLLQGPYLLEPGPDDPVYIWPRLFFVPQPKEEDWAEVAGIYPPSQLNSFIELGEYLGLRLGIGADASWRFAVSGD